MDGEVLTVQEVARFREAFEDSAFYLPHRGPVSQCLPIVALDSHEALRERLVALATVLDNAPTPEQVRHAGVQYRSWLEQARALASSALANSRVH